VNFADRLFQAVKKKHSAVVVGIDPDPALIPRSYFPDPLPDARVREALAKGYIDFAGTVIDAVKDVAVAIKPQLAHFERLGPAGIAAFERVVEIGREAGLLVIADGKRSDIGSTAEMYAAAYLGAPACVEGACAPRGAGGDKGPDLGSLIALADREGPKADALTVNPYLGWDGIGPFLGRGEATGIFVLVKTSNPSSGELQDLALAGYANEPAAEREGGLVRTVAGTVARALEARSAALKGESGYGPVGAVVGATYPEQLELLRGLMPHVPILIPGYGAQGGTAADVVRGFDAEGSGAVVNASRSILYAWRDGGTVAEASRRAAIRMRDALRDALDQRRRLFDAGRRRG